ncbi:PRC-barrel domain containing protein [Streptomyces lydicus]|uniref:PRC-barrel domain containing protein n=1 Tax=Streptomyces lydicus TaxID=47763 RepID=UPI003433643D
MNSIWTYAPDLEPQGTTLTGFSVETATGTIGQVERQTDQPGVQHLVVDTGVWVFGKSVLIPAGIVTGVDRAAKVVTVARTKEEIKAAPRFTVDSETADLGYLAEVGSYYSGLPALARV